MHLFMIISAYNNFPPGFLDIGLTTDIGSEKFCKSVRLVTVADNLQQNSIETSILSKVTTRYQK